MELLMALVIGVIFAAGTYLILARSLVRVVFGTVLLTHGVLLMLLTMSHQLTPGERGLPAVLFGDGPFADPLPQALILTAIVIGFAVTAFVIVLAYRTYQELGTDDLEELRGVEDEQ
jgi:multicomponent Na+:H+ antiporter subunit C